MPWEESQRYWAWRLWHTALATSLEPQRFFAELPRGRIGPALWFALLAESFALSSLALLLGLVLLLAAPELALELSRSVVARRAFAVLLAGSVPLMLALHALWGVCLEAGAGQAARSWPQGLRFALYACGWDLLTSPAGVVCALLTHGFRFGAPIRAAARAPLRAQRAYLEVQRGLDAEARKRVVRVAMLAVGSVVCGLLCAVLGALLLVARGFGY